MLKAIIVDDNDSDLYGIRDFVDWNNLEIEVVALAHNGEEGLKQAIIHRPDIILTDIAMPIMDGLQMLALIRDVLPSMKVIIMSSYDDFEYAKSAINYHVSAYILKPVNLNELTDILVQVKNERIQEIETKQNEYILKQRLHYSLPALREQFLRALLLGKIISDSELFKNQQYLSIPSYSYCLAVSAQIDNIDDYFETNSVEDTYILLYKFKEYLEKEITNTITGYIIEIDNSQCVLILLFNFNSENECLDILLPTLSNCKYAINNNLNVKVTFGVSDFSTSLSELSYMFKCTQKAIDLKFYSSGNKVILFSEIKTYNSLSSYNLQEIKLEINNILESGTPEEINNFVSEYFKTSENYGKILLKSFCVSVISIVQIFINEKNIYWENIFDDEYIVWKKIHSFETIIDIKQWLTNVLLSVRQYLENHSGNRILKIVEEIKNLIDVRYAEIENVNQIANWLLISGGYANFLFKKQTGKTIFDYLTLKRIEEAKNFLKDPFVKIYQVSELVGYKSQAHFSMVFKDNVGISPKEYQQTIAE